MCRRRSAVLFAMLALGAGACATTDAGPQDAAQGADGGHTGAGGGAGTGSGGAGQGGTAGTGSGGATATGGTSGAGGTGGAAGHGGSGGAAGSGSGSGGTAGAGSGGTGGTSSGGAGGGGAGGGGVGGNGGVGGSGGAGGAANLPPGVSNLFPRPNAQGLCPDPPLRLTFPSAPTIGTAGTIRVFNAAQPGTAVATVDVGATTFSATIGGMTFATQLPVYVDGNDAVVYLPPHALAYGQTYYVNVDAGAIKPPGGATLSITSTTAWRFSTAAAAPTNHTAISVALDGSAPFCTVQGATDLVPANNTAATTITIATGTYHEIVHFTSKSNVTLLGQDQNGTVIAATNNNNLNPSTKGRSLVGIDNSTNLTVRNLTIHNLTPQGGSQAEALRLEGCDMCVVRNATVISLQDTLLWSGRIYANSVLIEGNVDYVWGTGAAYFVNSEIRTIVRSGPNVQARNPATTYGYVFVDSKLTSDAGLTGGVLARIDVGTYPASHVAYINCTISPEIAAVGWQLTAGTDTSMLRFWEYQSVDPSGNPINVSSRLAGSTQLTAAQAAMMRDPTVVLAGWQPPAN